MNQYLYIAVLLYGCAVLCCKQGDRLPIQGATCRYAECRNGLWFLTQCASQLPAPLRDSDCVNDKCLPGVEGCKETTFFRHSTDNRAYYQCKGGRLLLKFCGKGKRFDPSRRMCYSEYKDEILVSFENDMILRKDEETKCKHGERRKKEGSCKEYYECIDGREVVLNCKKCENYDDRRKKCDYVFNAPCISVPPEPLVPTKPSTESPTSHTSPEFSPVTTNRPDVPSKETADPPSTSPEPTNPHVPEDLLPSTSPEPPAYCKKIERRGVQHNCKHYLECQGGELVTKMCGWLQYFDSESNKCAFTGYTCYENKTDNVNIS